MTKPIFVAYVPKKIGAGTEISWNLNCKKNWRQKVSSFGDEIIVVKLNVPIWLSSIKEMFESFYLFLFLFSTNLHVVKRNVPILHLTSRWNHHFSMTFFKTHYEMTILLQKYTKVPTLPFCYLQNPHIVHFFFYILFIFLSLFLYISHSLFQPLKLLNFILFVRPYVLLIVGKLCQIIFLFGSNLLVW